MKKILVFLYFLTGLWLAAAPIPDAGARKVLQKYAEAGKNYSVRSGRSAFFSRAQLKYGLERDDYLHRWTDFPLLQDSALSQHSNGSFINPAAWKIMVDTIRSYGIDGFSFFPATKGRTDLFNKAVTPGNSVSILPELILGQGLDKISPQVEKALANKNALRINGKIVFTTYPGTASPEFWLKLKKELTAKYGDRFLLLPMHTLPGNLAGTHVAGLNAAQVEQLAEIIRKWLRCFDGYYYNNPPLNEFRRYDAAFDRDVMIPLLKGILSEPEFQGKYLAWGTKVGHENYYEKGSFTYNCGGTSMLRGSVGSAVRACADIINLVEWDEENENTFFRPTAATSFSTRRLIRYFSGISKGKLLPPLAGDDLNVPDVILSYRRTLAAGETLTLELVNVPGKNSRSAVLPVRLTLRDIKGRAVKTFEGTLNAAKLDELRFNVKVSELLDFRTVIPELTVSGRSYRGFMPVDLRANYNTDHRWVKQPLRDLASCTAAVTITETLPDGKVKITGKISSASPLHHVALYDSGNAAYVHNTSPEFHETDDRVVIKLHLLAKPCAKIALTGSIRIRNAKNVICGKFSRRDRRFVVVRPDGWDLPGGIAPDSYNNLLLVCSMDRASAKNAVFEISSSLRSPSFTAPVFKGTVSVADILKKDIYAVTGKGMSVLLFAHNDQPMFLPPGIGKHNAEFSVIRQPSLPQSLFFIEAIDVNRKTFRSLPVTIYRPSGKKAEFSVFDFFGKKAGKVFCDRNLLTVQKMEISPRCGAVVRNTGGNMLSGMAGNMAALANNMYMSGENNYYSSLVISLQRKWADTLDSAPQMLDLGGGRFAWRFSGRQNISFPTATVYPQSGFELTMEVKPEHINGKQTLFTSGPAGFTLLLNKGIPVASLYRGNLPVRNVAAAAGVRLTAGKYSRIVVRFDQKTMQIFVDGKAGRAVPCSGYQLYPRAVSVGLGIRGEGFFGEISKLEMKPL